MLLDNRGNGRWVQQMKPKSSPTETPTTTAAPNASHHWLIVINHREARVFQMEMDGTAPKRIAPHAGHAAHTLDFAKGKEKPDLSNFFSPIADVLKTGGEFVVLGSGTGTSSEMAQFVAWLKTHHTDLAQRLRGTAVVDASHLSDGQLLSKARALYEA